MNDTESHTGPASETEPLTGAGRTTAGETQSMVAADTKLVYDDTPAPPGRPVRLVPTPPGFWRLVLGAVGAVLAPFFGILVGSTIGSHDTVGRMDPLYWGFFIGGLVGVVGLVAAVFGGLMLIRNSRSKDPEEQP